HYLGGRSFRKTFKTATAPSTSSGSLESWQRCVKTVLGTSQLEQAVDPVGDVVFAPVQHDPGEIGLGLLDLLARPRSRLVSRPPRSDDEDHRVRLAAQHKRLRMALKSTRIDHDVIEAFAGTVKKLVEVLRSPQRPRGGTEGRCCERVQRAKGVRRSGRTRPLIARYVRQWHKAGLGRVRDETPLRVSKRHQQNAPSGLRERTREVGRNGGGTTAGSRADEGRDLAHASL